MSIIKWFLTSCVFGGLVVSNLKAATIYARADGDWDQTNRWSTSGVGGGSCSCTPSAGDDVIIDGYLIDIDGNTGSVTANTVTVRSDTRNDGSRLRVQGGSILTVTNDFTMFADRAGQDQTLIVEDASRLNVGGDFIIDQDTGEDLLIEVEDSGQLNVAGSFTVDKDGGDNLFILINDNTGNSAQIDIDNDFNYNCDGSFDAQQELKLNGTSSLFNVDGNFELSLTGGDDLSTFDFNFNSGSCIVDGYMSIARSGDFGNVDFDLDGGDITVDSINVSSSGTNGGDRGVRFFVDGDSQLDVNTGMNVSMTGGDDFYIRVNDNAGTSGQFNVGNDLTITRSSGDDIYLQADDDNSVFSVGGDLSITSIGGEEIDIVLDNDAAFTVTGNLSITHSAGQSGEIDLSTSPDNSTLTVGGNMNITYTGGNDLFTMDLNGGTVNVTGNVTLSNTGSGSDIFVDMDGGDWNVTGNFDALLSGNDEILIDIDDDSQLNVTGNMELDLSGGNDLELHLGMNTTNSTAQLNVTANLTLDHNGNIGGDDIQFLINDDCEVHVGGVFTMDTDGSGTAGNFYCRMFDNALLDVDGNFVMTSTSSGFLEVTLNDNSEIEIAGNFVRPVSPNNFGLLTCLGSSVIEYNGASNQLFAEDDGAGTDGFTYQNVIINNTFGTSPQLTMEGEATVNGLGTFTDGVVSSNSSDILVFADGATVSGASNASHVDGPVRKVGNEAFTFPVGDVDYLPIAISAPGLAIDAFEAQYIATDPDASFSRSNLGTGIDHVSSLEYWILDRTNGTSDVSVTLFWDASSDVTNLAELLVSRWNSSLSQWESHGNSGTTGNTTAGTLVTSAAVTDFSPFALSSSTVNNPLPIDLLSFNAIATSEGVRLEWITAVEINNDFFTIERSVDAKVFETIATLPGAGNSIGLLNYSDVDRNPLAGISYYRLKQTDFDGGFSYSDVATVEYNSDETLQALIAYPNPFSNALALLNVPENTTRISLHDMLGNEVLNTKASTRLNPELAAPGVYLLQLWNEQGTRLASSMVIYQP